MITFIYDPFFGEAVRDGEYIETSAEFFKQQEEVENDTSNTEHSEAF